MKLLCPLCGSQPLDLNGVYRPKRVVDLEEIVWLITWRYHCKVCRKGCSGWAPRLLDSLPTSIRLAFPAVLSRKGGLTLRVAQSLLVAGRQKSGISGFHKQLLHLHTHKFDRAHLQYLEACREVEEKNLGICSQNQDTGQCSLVQYCTIKDAAPFGNFWDQDRYAGYVPSQGYLTTMFNRLVEADTAVHNQHTVLLPTDAPAASDDSFKLAKHLAHYEGTPVFNALFTVMTGFFIRSQVLTYTKSHAERAPVLADIAAGLQKYNTGIPPYWSDDDPEAIKSMMAPFAEALRRNMKAPLKASNLKSLTLAENFQFIVCNTERQAEIAFGEIMAEINLRPSQQHIFHVDAEWNISRRTGVSCLVVMKHNDPCRAWFIRVWLEKVIT